MRYTDVHRRGAAFLIVLATLALAVTASVGLARSAMCARVTRDLDCSDRYLVALLGTMEGPIQSWLSASADVVLSTDALVPNVPILFQEEVRVESTRFAMNITAYDLDGMVAAELLRGGSPLRAVVPEDVVRAVLAVEEFDGLDRVVGMEDTAAFPRGDDGDRLSVGACVASHAADPPRLNVNTTPIPVLEAALRWAGMDGLDAIIAARDAGEAAPAPRPVDVDDESEERLEIVSGSSRWAMRIDLAAGESQRSWWAVYERHRGRGGARRSNWRCVQRMLIHD